MPANGRGSGAILCQREITWKTVEKGGDYLFPVKVNQKDLHDEIAIASNEPTFPLKKSYATLEADHGRIEQRKIAILPVNALSEYMRDRWPSIKSIVRIGRTREHMRNDITTTIEIEIVWLISSLKCLTQ